MKVAIVTTDGVAVMSLLSETTNVDEEVAKWKTSNPDKYVSHSQVEDSDIPTDRTFRNAWKGDLTVDMSKARDIQKNILRKLRKPLLERADMEYLRALETDDKQKLAEIKDQKDTLRAVTDDPTIALAKNPEELKAAIPEILK